MSSAAHRPATYADLVKAPDHLIAEILDGELHLSPHPAPRETVFQVGRGGPGDWWMIFGPEVHLGADILVPDLGGWRRTRLRTLPDEAYFKLAPDWICEVLSPATYRLDRVKKLRIYAREGVAHAWLVHPGERTLEVLRLEAGRWVIVGTFGGDAIVRAEPFADVEIDLLPLWGESRPAAKPKAKARRRAARKPARRRP